MYLHMTYAWTDLTCRHAVPSLLLLRLQPVNCSLKPAAPSSACENRHASAGLATRKHIYI